MRILATSPSRLVTTVGTMFWYTKESAMTGSAPVTAPQSACARFSALAWPPAATRHTPKEPTTPAKSAPLRPSSTLGWRK